VASFVDAAPGRPRRPRSAQALPRAHGFIAKVIFSSSSVIVKLLDGAHARAGVCAPGRRHAGRRSRACSRLSIGAVMLAPAAVHALAPRLRHAIIAEALLDKDTRSRTPPAIRSWSICQLVLHLQAQLPCALHLARVDRLDRAVHGGPGELGELLPLRTSGLSSFLLVIGGPDCDRAAQGAGDRRRTGDRAAIAERLAAEGMEVLPWTCAPALTSC